jgi:RNA polymerase sigma-70 factor, ECF subfamily
LSAPQRSMRTSSETPDAALMSRIAGGDLGALGNLYDRYARDLLRFTRRITSSEDAEDVVQNTFLRVLQRAARYDASVTSARPWLFGIAARVAQERRRALRRFTATLVAFGTSPPRSPPSPTETRRDLAKALARLSAAKRITLILADVEGFSSKEIARMLSIPVGTVWTRLHHARRQFKIAYEGDDP